MHENSDVSEEEDRYLLVAPSESLPPPVHLINVPPLLPQSSSCVSCLTLFHPSRHPVDQPLLRCLSPLPFALVYEPSLIYFLSAFIKQVCQKVLYVDQRTTNTDKKKAKAKDKSKKVRAHQK